MWYVIVNENMLDAEAFISESDEGLSGWERVWSSHPSKEEALMELSKAEEHVAGKRLP